MLMFNLRRINFWINSIPFLLSFFMVLFILIFGEFLPPKLPLFYSLPWGESQLGSKQQVLIIPAGITLIALLNLILSWQLHSSQVFFKKVLTFSSLLVSLILTLAFLKKISIFI